MNNKEGGKNKQNDVVCNYLTPPTSGEEEEMTAPQILMVGCLVAEEIYNAVDVVVWFDLVGIAQQLLLGRHSGEG